MERTIRYSKKREAILDVIRSTDCHPSAEWVYQKLKPSQPDLSLGTVYRNLTFFLEHGLVRSVGVINGQERFDGNISHHPHFICNCCGSVIDLHGLKEDANLDRTVSQEYGLAVQGHDLVFHGECQICMQNNKTEEDILS